MSARYAPARKRISNSRPNSPKTKISPTHSHGPSPGRFLPQSHPSHRPTLSLGTQTAHLSLVSDKIEKLLRTGSRKRPGTRGTARAHAKPISPLHAGPDRSTTRHKRTSSLASRPTTSLPSSRLGPDSLVLHKRKLSAGQTLPVVAKFAHRSQVGYQPNNPHKVNQDNFIEAVNFAGKTNAYLFAVADGHGTYGHEVSRYIKKRLPVLLSQESAIFSTPKKAISAAVIRCNMELKNAQFDVNFSGSTLTLALIDNYRVWCGNVGDSRTLIARQLPEDPQSHSQAGLRWMAIALSRDHKPDEEDEAFRITKAGGRIESYQDEEGNPLGPPRVWLQHQDVPGLAMSRSLGDFVAASVGVSCEPETLEFPLTPEDKFLVIASDGVFEFISNEDVVRVVVPFWKAGDPAGACEALSREAHNRWTTEEEVIDDITCVVVFLDVRNSSL